MNIRASGQYYGAKEVDYKVGGISLSEYQYHAAGTPWHYHEHPYFMYVLQGNMTDVNSHGKKSIPAGSLAFHNWQDPHLNEKKSTRARGFHLEMDRNWFDAHKLDINLWEGSQILERPRLHHLLGKIYYEFKKQDAYSEMAIELLVFQLCEQIDASTYRKPQKEPPWIKTLKEILHDQSDNLSLKYLSQQLGVHPVHLSRAVPTYLDANLGEYIRQQKIKRAFNYLVDPCLSLSYIAYECGFVDQSHFTRVFKTYFGQTPRVFRDSLIT